MTSSTTDLLSTNEIRTAIVVDDAYDPTPKAEDLVFDSDQWSIFLDDITPEDLATLRSIYPDYTPEREAALFQDDGFISSLWDARGRFRDGLTDPLFDTYIHDSEHDLRIVRAVESTLRALGLSVDTAGRKFIEPAVAADLIVIDLFLGAQQTETDMLFSVQELAKVIARRADTPPIIVLMSRSGKLALKADRFRDDANVFASGFRSILKSDIVKPDRLEHLIRELARHRPDSLKLNTFLRRWAEGLEGAVKRTQQDIRRLDLEDWAQIRDLLLTAEKSTAGRYILEILELAFLHELESDEPIVSAAAALDTLQRETYPPTTIAASKDTIGLVSKTLYEHQNCHQLDVSITAPVAFGDIIGPIRGQDFEDNPALSALNDAVLITMTPACDLQRGDVARVLFMVGETKDVDAPAAGQPAEGLRTPILSLGDTRRVWVVWRPTHLITLSFEEVHTLFSTTNASVKRLARLRTANAVSLQQQLLSSLGRVGLVAPMPSTFPIQVAVHYPSKNHKLVPLSIGDEETITGVCYVGRGTDKMVATAPFDSIHRFAFLDALEGLTDDQVSGHSRALVTSLRRVETMDLLFSRGLTFNPAKKGLQTLKESIDGQEVPIGKLVIQGPASNAFSRPNQIRGAGIVFEIRGLPLTVDT